MGLGFVVASVPYVFLFAISTRPWLAVALSVGICGYGSSLWLNRRGYHYAAKVAPIVSALAVVTTFSAALGRAWNLQVTLFMVTAWTFNLFSVRKNPKTLLLLASAPGVSYLAIETGALNGSPYTDAPEWFFGLFSTVTLFVGYGLLTWVLWVFYRANERNEDRLVRNVEKLRAEVAQREASQRRAEEALAMAERAGRAKSEFLAVMSHELRTPLNGVVGSADLLLDTTLDRSQRSMVYTVQHCSTFLLALVNNLLDFAAMESGTVHLSTKNMSLLEVLEDTVLGFASRAEEKGLSFVFDVHPNVPRCAHGDEGRVRQVLNNLVDNAIKFTEQGRVVVRVWAESEADSAHRLHLEVADTGIGIEDDQRDLIFDGFRQQDSRLNRRYEGVGLGLSISRLLARAMDGDISSARRPGGGSVFSAHLRLGHARRTSSNPSTAIAVGGDLRCRVVCGDEARVRAVEHALRRIGVQIASADGGSEGVQAVIVDGVDHMEGDFQAHLAKWSKQMSVPEYAVVALSIRPGATASRNLLPCPFRLTDLVDAMEAIRRPAASDCAPASPRITLDRIDLRGARILVAEDNRVNQKVLLSMLRKLGAEGTAFADGQQAVDAFAEGQWDAVLMDIQMPVMDGLMATERIREMERTREGKPHIPIIAVSANAMPDDIQRGLDSGIDAYLPKPLQIATLESMLSQYLSDAEEDSALRSSTAG